MEINRRTLAGLGLAGALGVGLAIPAVAQDTGTQGTTESESTESEAPESEAPTETEDRRAEHDDRRAEHDQEFAAALAAELGLDQDTVATAIDTVRSDLTAARRAEVQERVQERLDELVETGELTREQADALAELQEERASSGRGHRGLGGGRGHHGPLGGGLLDEAPSEAGTSLDDSDV